jgi:hypothetical protein
VRGVQLRWSGHTLLAEADVEVDPDLTVRRPTTKLMTLKGDSRLGSAG